MKNIQLQQFEGEKQNKTNTKKSLIILVFSQKLAATTVAFSIIER